MSSVDPSGSPPGRERVLAAAVRDALRKKMVFIGGPRQVGKTTLAPSLFPDEAAAARGCFNWDHAPHRAVLRRQELPQEQLFVLDEVHKFARWRSLVKGVHDVMGKTVRIVVTGSARLDYYRKGGDSLQGRYRYFRLHPFSVPELAEGRPARTHTDRLLKFGGFPEPLFAESEAAWRLWQRERLARIIDGDLRDLERVKDTSFVEMLADALPARVGSPLSVRALREDMEVAHETAERWIQILERLYVCFRIPPYGPPRIRAVKKEQKLYLWDWSVVEDAGARFENFVASHLLKYCHFREDTLGHRMELRYLRDTDKREVDFVVLEDRRPKFAVECKLSERGAGDTHVGYFRQRTPIPKFYVTHLGTADFGNPQTTGRVLPFERLCEEVGLV